MAMETRLRYRMNYRKITQLMFAGALALGGMALLGYLLRAMGIPAPDFASQFGAILYARSYPTQEEGAWWTGLLWYLLNGIVLFPILYDYLAHKMVLPSQRHTKGLLYGAGLWLLMGIVVAPMAGDGFFYSSVPNPLVTSLASLICWLVYGVTLEEATRIRAVHYLGRSREAA